MNQFNQEFKPCRYCGREGSDNHHMLKRSTNPELIDDPKNLVFLCRSCHIRTENDQEFLKDLQDIFYNWKAANLDLYLRAEASIEALLKDGKNIDFSTPYMVDNYLTLATASYSHISEKLIELEKLYPIFYLTRKKEVEDKKEKITETQIKSEWDITSNGQLMIQYVRKVKILDKIQSTLKAKLRRFEVECFNTR